MIRATSAGAILFRDTRGRREYLLLKSRPGDWEFPKGGVEGDEELQQTAIREVKEEAGIEEFRLLDGFRDDYDYVFEANGNTIHKTVHLFIARSFEASAELSPEHRDLQWRDYEQAINTITQDGPREILEEAHEFIDEKLAEDDGSVDDGSVDDGSVDDESVDDESVDDGSVDDEAATEDRSTSEDRGETEEPVSAEGDEAL